MTLRSEEKTSSISLFMEWIDCDARHGYESLTAEVSDRGFRGAVTAWPDDGAILHFLEQLRQCERTRRGRASLVLEELELYIESTDALGHFRLRYKLAGHLHTRGGSIPQMLTGGFDLDAERFLDIVEGFTRLMTGGPGNEHYA